MHTRRDQQELRISKQFRSLEVNKIETQNKITMQLTFLGMEGIAEHLMVDLKKGLDSKDMTDLEDRDGYFGSNKRPPPEIKGKITFVPFPFLSFQTH
jgi:hypothetical protein